MMKIEKLLTVSEKMSKGKKIEIARVQDFDLEDIKQIDKKKFKKGKSIRGVPRLEARCFVILEEDFEDFEREYDSQIQSLEQTISDHEETIEKLENQLSNIEEDHQKEMEDLEEEYSGKVDGLKADLHEKDLENERIKTNYEKELGVFRESIQKEINDLELFDEDKHMLIKDHNAEVSKLKANQFNSDYHMKVSDHEKELNKMRGNCLKLRVRDNKEYSSFIEELDNLGRLEKFRNKDKSILKEMRSYNKSAIDDKAIDVNFNLIEKGK